MGNLILYKFGVIGILVVVALWSFHVLPIDNNDDTEAILFEEFFEEPVISSSATPSLSSAPSPTKTLVPTSTPILTITPRNTPTLPLTSSQPSQGFGGQAGPMATLLATSTPILIPTPTSVPSLSSTPSPTPTPILSSTTPIPTTSLTPTPAPESNHIFYLSTYTTAKYYYCDTDNGWKSLSEKYLKSYSSEQELLADYPTKILHEPCK